MACAMRLWHIICFFKDINAVGLGGRRIYFPSLWTKFIKRFKRPSQYRSS